MRAPALQHPRTEAAPVLAQLALDAADEAARVERRALPAPVEQPRQHRVLDLGAAQLEQLAQLDQLVAQRGKAVRAPQLSHEPLPDARPTRRAGRASGSGKSSA